MTCHYHNECQVRFLIHVCINRERSFKHVSNKFVCPNISRHQTDKIESIPTVNRSLPEFDDFCRFEVGFVLVWPVWLGYQCVIQQFLAATKQHCEWFSPSVCPSHLFHYVPIIISSWNFQELLPLTELMSMQKVKVTGQRSRSKVKT